MNLAAKPDECIMCRYVHETEGPTIIKLWCPKLKRRVFVFDLVPSDCPLPDSEEADDE